MIGITNCLTSVFFIFEEIFRANIQVNQNDSAKKGPAAKTDTEIKILSPSI